MNEWMNEKSIGKKNQRMNAGANMQTGKMEWKSIRKRNEYKQKIIWQKLGTTKNRKERFS